MPFDDNDPAAGLLVFVEQTGGRGVGLNRQAAATQRAQASAFQEY